MNDHAPMCYCNECRIGDNSPYPIQDNDIASKDAEIASLKNQLSGLIEEATNYRGYLYGCNKHRLWQGMSCIGCIEKDRDSLREQNGRLREALEVIATGNERVIHREDCCCNNCVAKEALNPPTK